MTRDDLRVLVEDTNMQAFLMVIRAGEGTSDADGYRRMFGGDLFDSFADHPRQLHTRNSKNGPLSSTAAGAYQILSRTWDEMAAKYGLPDFSPECQDEAAAGLIDRRGATSDVIGGYFDAAVRKCCKEWASLPYSPWGQPRRTFTQALDVYAAAGGKIAEA